MILQLLVVAVAVGLTVAEPPEYKQTVAAVQLASDLMKTNILSMDGNIPLLNDSRRHYAEIIHVIYSHGEKRYHDFKFRQEHGTRRQNLVTVPTNCLPGWVWVGGDCRELWFDEHDGPQSRRRRAIHPFYRNYANYLNSSAPEAINNPKIVIDEIKDLLVDIDNKTSELKALIRACVDNDEACNELIDDNVKENQVQFGNQATVLFAAGKVANELIERNGKFEEVSSNLAAHQYVISAQSDLYGIVELTAKLLYAVREHS